MKNFNVSKFVVDFSQSDKNKITDVADIPNLLLLDSYDLISMVLRKKSNIFLQYSTLNPTTYLDTLYQRVEATNSILRSLGTMHYILLNKKSNETQISHSQPVDALPYFSDDFNENVVQLLVKLKILKTSLKLCCEDLPVTHIVSDETSIFFNKQIDAKTCTNCSDCVTYCPTQAFTYKDNNKTICFNSGQCIGCNICEDICMPKAISKDFNIDLIAFAFDQEVQKITFAD